MKAEFLINNLSEMENLGLQISKIVSKGFLVTLSGELGSGKTTLARHIISSMGGVDKNLITSPTFNLVSTYETDKGKVWHFDLYRVHHYNELRELAIDDALMDITIIEWPLVAQNILPSDDRIDVTIKYDKNPNSRIVQISFPTGCLISL